MRDKVQRQFVQKEKGKQGEREEERRSDKEREYKLRQRERNIVYLEYKSLQTQKRDKRMRNKVQRQFVH